MAHVVVDGSARVSLGRLAASDETVGRIVLRVANLLEPPSSYHRPQLRSTVQPILDDGPPDPPPVDVSRVEPERLVSRGSGP